MGPDPHTGEGFDAPVPTIAYAYAPALLEEMAAVGQESTRLLTAALAGEAVDAGDERVYLLRKAAALDRVALLQPGDVEVTDAARSAHELAQHDRATGERWVSGPYGPGAIEWDPSCRPYVRQEYAAWSLAQVQR